MITYYKRTVHEKQIKKLQNFETGCWINVVNPSKEEIDFLVDKFKIDRENIISGLDINEVPRVEFAKDKIYIIVKTISEERPYLNTILILIAPNYILTLSRKQPNFIFKVLKENMIITTQKYRSLIIFLSLINKEFENSTIETVKIVNNLAASSKKIKENEIYTLLNQEEKLNFYVSSYYYTKMIYEKLIKNLKFFEEDRDIIEDLIISAEEGLNLCKSSLKTISNIREYYNVMISTRINTTITVLTLFTIFLTIFTATSGFYGMNVPLPFQNVPFISIYILIFSFLLGSLVLIFAKFKWL